MKQTILRVALLLVGVFSVAGISAQSIVEAETPKDELFRQADPSGIVLTITSILVVAVALTVLFLIFKYIGDFHIRHTMKKARALQGVEKDKPTMVTNDELAAISIALYKYLEEFHDIENTVLTINQMAKVYSPWNSKIYNMNQLHLRK